MSERPGTPFRPALSRGRSREPPSGLSHPRTRRLRHRREFLAVRRRGRSVRNGVLRIGFLRQGDGPPRLGLAVSRRMGNAVVRNRIKRVVREAFRTAPDLFPPGLSVVVIPLDPVRAQRFHEVRASLSGLSERIRRALDPGDSP